MHGRASGQMSSCADRWSNRSHKVVVPQPVLEPNHSEKANWAPTCFRRNFPVITYVDYRANHPKDHYRNVMIFVFFADMLLAVSGSNDLRWKEGTPLGIWLRLQCTIKHGLTSIMVIKAKRNVVSQRFQHHRIFSRSSREQLMTSVPRRLQSGFAMQIAQVVVFG